MAKFIKLSLKDRLVAELRGKILSGELRPRARITEQGLCDEYGVSRSVVREAMLVLELQGLLVSTPYTGSEVASISRSEVEELLLPLRVQTEQFALRQGFQHLDSEYFQRFETVLKAMERAVYDRDVVAFNESDFQFHALIVESADSDIVRNVWDVIHQPIRMHFALQTGRTGALVGFLDDHRQLLDVFRSGDLEASVTAIKDHIIETNRPFLDVLDQPETA